MPLAIPVPLELAELCLTVGAGAVDRAGLLDPEREFVCGGLAGGMAAAGVEVRGAGRPDVRRRERRRERRALADDAARRCLPRALRGARRRGTAGVATSPVIASPRALRPATRG
ncbi:MAG: hypothetical protein ACRDPA_09685 [Solirubrobacteraceae bacterium]